MTRLPTQKSASFMVIKMFTVIVSIVTFYWCMELNRPAMIAVFLALIYIKVLLVTLCFSHATENKNADIF